MKFKKKRSFREIALAILVMFVYIAVPVWGLMYVMITKSVAAGLALLGWMGLSYFIGRRFE